MDFKLLYSEDRSLFAVGYNLSQGRLDSAHYDLLASESALTSYLAVARGDVPKKHWFQLGRPLTRAAGSVALLSWGGTMFEYLMPRLLLPAVPETLLDDSRRGAVARQIEYGRQCGVPWGVSESAFNVVDAALNYQYQAFGVPGLGLKRGLAKDLVIAPYATALAVMIRAAFGGTKSPPFGRGGRRRRLRLLRGHRLHARTAATEAALRRGEVLHGPPPGHVADGPGELPARRADAAAFPGRADGARRRVAARGVHGAGSAAGAYASPTRRRCGRRPKTATTP